MIVPRLTPVLRPAVFNKAINERYLNKTLFKISSCFHQLSPLFAHISTCTLAPSRYFHFVSHRLRDTDTAHHTAHRPHCHWSVYNMSCPGNQMRWDLTSGDLDNEAEKLITKSKAVYDLIGSMNPDDVTVENVIKVRVPLTTAITSFTSNNLRLFNE